MHAINRCSDFNNTGWCACACIAQNGALSYLVPRLGNSQQYVPGGYSQAVYMIAIFGESNPLTSDTARLMGCKAYTRPLSYFDTRKDICLQLSTCIN